VKYAKSLNEYLNEHPQGLEKIQKLRSIILEIELTETLNYEMPTHVLSKHSVIAIGAFKNWSVLWFYDGDLL
jgi:uncharacterized protein YdeI (YjbR/CyaY-like superfamily)